MPSGGHCGSLFWVFVRQLGHWYWCSIKSMICLFWRFGSSSIRWCLTAVGCVRGVWQFGQVQFGGWIMVVGVFCFCRVVPLCFFGGPGKRFLVVGL